MTIRFLTFLALSVSVFGLAACMAPASTLPPGHYENTSKTTNSKGTDIKTEKQTDVYYDQYGNKRATTQTETTRDPKGLFNKETTKSVKTTY